MAPVTSPCKINVNVNVNVHVYSPDIPIGSADCTIYTPGIGTHSEYLTINMDKKLEWFINTQYLTFLYQGCFQGHV